jgi:hypothetical protein
LGFVVRKFADQAQPPWVVLAGGVSVSPTCHEAGVRHDRPRETLSRASLDRFHGGEIFTRKSEEIAGMTVDDFGDLVAVLPNYFPALAQIGNVSG